MLDSSASGLNLPGVSLPGPLYTTITITLLLFKQQFHTYLKIVLDRTNGHWCVLKRELLGFCARYRRADPARSLQSVINSLVIK